MDAPHSGRSLHPRDAVAHRRVETDAAGAETGVVGDAHGVTCPGASAHARVSADVGMAAGMAGYRSVITPPARSSLIARHESPAVIAAHDPYPDTQAMTSINVLDEGGSIT